MNTFPYTIHVLELKLPRRSSSKYSCNKYWLYNCTEHQHCCFSCEAFHSPSLERYVETHEPPSEKRRKNLALQFIFKLKANPQNSAYDVVFSPKHKDLYKRKEAATDPFGIYCNSIIKGSKDVCWGNCYQQHSRCSYLGFWTSYCWFYFIRIWQVVYFLYCF